MLLTYHVYEKNKYIGKLKINTKAHTFKNALKEAKLMLNEQGHKVNGHDIIWEGLKHESN